MTFRKIATRLGWIAAGIAAALSSDRVDAQSFNYESRPKAATSSLTYASPDPAPRMMEPAEALPRDRGYLYSREQLYGRNRRYGGEVSQAAYDAPPASRSQRMLGWMRTSYNEQIPAGKTVDPFAEELPPGGPVEQYDTSLEPEPFMEDPSDGIPDYCPDSCHTLCHCLKVCLSRCVLFRPETWQNFNEFGGVQGFKGPADMGVNGNFGFHKGVNWASPFWDAMGIGYQLGGSIVLSDFEGKSGPLGSRRDQYFITTGFFRRAECYAGLQGGAVLDYLHDDFYVTMNLMQIRSEISYLWRNYELGVWIAAHTKSDTQTLPAYLGNTQTTWQANNQYNLFFRERFANGGTGRMWVGLTDYGGVLFGSDATAPLSERWAIQGSYNYLLPNGDSSVNKNVQESWNLSLSLVWYPGYKVPNACFNPYRPLFTVADNGTLMITQK